MSRVEPSAVTCHLSRPTPGLCKGDPGKCQARHTVTHGWERIKRAFRWFVITDGNAYGVPRPGIQSRLSLTTAPAPPRPGHGMRPHGASSTRPKGSSQGRDEQRVQSSWHKAGPDAVPRQPVLSATGSASRRAGSMFGLRMRTAAAGGRRAERWPHQGWTKSRGSCKRHRLGGGWGGSLASLRPVAVTY